MGSIETSKVSNAQFIFQSIYHQKLDYWDRAIRLLTQKEASSDKNEADFAKVFNSMRSFYLILRPHLIKRNRAGLLAVYDNEFGVKGIDTPKRYGIDIQPKTFKDDIALLQGYAMLMDLMGKEFNFLISTDFYIENVKMNDTPEEMEL